MSTATRWTPVLAPPSAMSALPVPAAALPVLCGWVVPGAWAGPVTAGVGLGTASGRVEIELRAQAMAQAMADGTDARSDAQAEARSGVDAGRAVFVVLDACSGQSAVLAELNHVRCEHDARPDGSVLIHLDAGESLRATLRARGADAHAAPSCDEESAFDVVYVRSSVLDALPLPGGRLVRRSGGG